MKQALQTYVLPVGLGTTRPTGRTVANSAFRILHSALP